MIPLFWKIWITFLVITIFIVTAFTLKKDYNAFLLISVIGSTTILFGSLIVKLLIFVWSN